MREASEEQYGHWTRRVCKRLKRLDCFDGIVVRRLGGEVVITFETSLIFEGTPFASMQAFADYQSVFYYLLGLERGLQCRD